MAVGDAHVFPGFLTPVLTQLSFQSHRFRFSHASAEVRGENTLERKFTSTGDRTHNHQIMSPTRSPLSHQGGAINVIHQLISDTTGKALNVRQAKFSFSYAVVTRRPKIKFNNVVRMGFKLHPALFLKLGGTPSLKNETIFQGKNMRDIFK